MRRVTVKSGERWSLIIFVFRSCAEQTAFFAAAEEEQQRRGAKTDDESGPPSPYLLAQGLLGALHGWLAGWLRSYGGAPYARAASPILMVLGLLLVHVVLWVAVVPCGCCRCMWDQDEEEQEEQEDKKKDD